MNNDQHPDCAKCGAPISSGAYCASCNKQDYGKLSNRECDVLIAKHVMGWTELGYPFGKVAPMMTTPDGRRHGVPSYSGCRNACHAALEKLQVPRRPAFERHIFELLGLSDREPNSVYCIARMILSATPRQLCEAMLAALDVGTD